MWNSFLSSYVDIRRNINDGFVYILKYIIWTYINTDILDFVKHFQT